MLIDKRVKRQAEILVNYSTKVKGGDLVQIVGNEIAKPLILEIYRAVLHKKPAEVIIRVGFDEFSEIYYSEADESQLKKFPQSRMDLMEKTDVFIAIHAPANTRALSGFDPGKQALRSTVTKPISDYRVENTRWVITAYPTQALAQEADMGISEFSDFIVGAIVDVDWDKKAQEQEGLKKMFDEAKEVKIVGEDTDLTLSVAGRTTVADNGEHNMPGGEVFTSVEENSTNGKIRYSYPAIYGGREVTDIRLEFRNGKVINATAAKGEEFLKKMIAMDEGAGFIGELGVGNNFKIDRFIKNILYDEKMGGSVHIALGRGYKETGSENDSALHWDMIKDLREGGELILDGKVVQKDGRWVS